MTKEELAVVLLGDFYEDFASVMARLVVEDGCVGILYDLAVDPSVTLPKVLRDKLLFRAAYTLETIYFSTPEHFMTMQERFCADFVRCTNSSAKRHFGKIMAHMLKNHRLTTLQCEAIAETVSNWVMEPGVRVAVQINAVDILFMLRSRVDWVRDVLPEIIEMLNHDPSPAMQIRLRRWSALGC